MAKKQKIRRFIFSLAVLLIGSFALWQYSARLLDSGLEAGAARALDTKVTVSGSRLTILKPSYFVKSVRAEVPLGDPPFFATVRVGCRTSWRKLLDDVLTVELVRIGSLVINLTSEDGRWNIEGLGSSEEGLSVEEITEIVVGLALDQLAKLADATVPLELLSSTARDLLPQSLDAKLTSRVEEFQSKIDRELGRIQRDLEGSPGKLEKGLEGLLAPSAGKD